MQRDTREDLLSPGAHEVEVNGLRQSYHVHGSGPVCLVVPGGPGDRAGLKPSDLITAIGGRAVVDQPSLASALGSLQPGQTVQVTVLRADGSSASLPVTLGELPG